jgi:hypothetical protein
MLLSTRHNIIDNYRRMYKARHSVDYKLSDDSIIEYYNNAHGAPTAEDCDDWVLEDMFYNDNVKKRGK